MVFGRFWIDLIPIIRLNKFSYITLYYWCYLIFYYYYICYIIVVIEKDKYSLLNLLHLNVTNIYIYNFNLYQKN